MFVFEDTRIVDFFNTIRLFTFDMARNTDVEAASAVLYELIQEKRIRFEYNLPLLQKTENFEDLKNKMEELLAAAETLIGEIGLSIKRKDFSSLSVHISNLENNIKRQDELVEEFRQLRKLLPEVSVVFLIGDTLIIGVEVTRGNVQEEHLYKRIPELFSLGLILEEKVSEFRKYFPDEKEIIQTYEEGLDEFKTAVGGLETFRENGNTNDLSNALTLLSKADKKLEAAGTAADMIINENSFFSDHPVLQKAWWIFDDYQKGKRTMLDVLPVLSMLKGLQTEHARTVIEFEREKFLKQNLRQEYIPKLIDNLDRRDLVIAYMKDKMYQADEILTALEQYKMLLKEFVETLDELEEKESEKPEMAGAGQIGEILDLIRMSFYRKTPDYYTVEKCRIMLDLGEAFGRHLLLEKRQNPETASIVDRISEIINKQKIVFETVIECLNSGNRHDLISAYEQLEENASVMKSIQKELDEIKEKSIIEPIVLCPFCASENKKTSRSCGKCGRQLPQPDGDSDLLLNLQETDSGEALSLDASGVPLPENIRFLKKILDNTACGLLTFEEADEMLSPFWEQLVFVEDKLKNSIQSVVNTVKDTSLAGTQERFLEITENYKSLLQDIYTAIDNRDEAALSRFSGEASNIGAELYNLNSDINSSMEKAASSK